MSGFKRLTCAGVVTGLIASSATALSQLPDTRRATTEPAATQPSGVLEPVKDATTQPAEAADTREGTMLDLVGQIAYNAKHEAQLRFRPHEGAPFKTLPILPNQNLERMESTLESRGKDTWFQVSVVITVYQNHNYVLIRDVSLLLGKP